MTRGHAERLAPLAAEVMHEAGIAFGELTRVVVTVGPGSFTGVRVGLAFARSLALSLNVPCIGISTLEALAGDGAFERAGAIEAPDGIYVAVYGAQGALTPPQKASLDDARAAVAGVRVRGPGAALLGGEIVPFPDPVILARLGADRDPAKYPPAPQYLRAPDAKLPQPRS